MQIPWNVFFFWSTYLLLNFLCLVAKVDLLKVKTETESQVTFISIAFNTDFVKAALNYGDNSDSAVKQLYEEKTSSSI